MRSIFLFGIALFAVTQALPLASTHGSSEFEKRLQEPTSTLIAAIRPSWSEPAYDNSRQPYKRDVCDTYRDLITARDNARGWGEQHTEAVQKLVDAFRESNSFQAIKSIFDKLFDDAKRIVDDAQASDTAHAFQEEFENLGDLLKSFKDVEDLKNKVQERFNSVKAEAQDLYDKAQKALDEAKPCPPPKPKPTFSFNLDRLA
jgi:gas vesicle protein